MADWAKIALKAGLVLGVMTALWAVFTQIQIPSGLPSSFVLNIVTACSFAYTFLTYWIPLFPTVWTLTLALFGVLVALWTFRFASVAVRWLFKVNE